MAKEPGFSTGNTFTRTQLDGYVTVRCQGNSEGHRCREVLWSPAVYAYFEMEPGVDADKVILNAIHEDGSTRDKKSKFKKDIGRSKKRFNLGVWSLFQRPLLEGGKNIIEYTLLKRKKVVLTGSFEVYVRTAEGRYCDSEYRYFNDCSSSQVVCRDYFRRHNYCR